MNSGFKKQNTSKIYSLLSKQTGALQAIANNPIVAIIIFIYIGLFAVLCMNRKEVFNIAAFGIGASIADMASTISLIILGVIGLLYLNVFVSTPYRFRNIESAFRRIGFTNAQGEVPRLVSCSSEKGGRKIRKFVFDANGIPLTSWKDKKDFVELALNVTIINIKISKRKSRIEVFAVDGDTYLPDFIQWDDDFLSSGNFEIVLGEGLAGPIIINLAAVPGVLIAGATGSGKTILFTSILYQALKKGARVALADLKGGIDFSVFWHERCWFCTEKSELLEILVELGKIQEQRKQLFSQYGARNIDDYNKKTGKNMKRYILACDEVAEILQKNGLDRADKELVYKLQKEISKIARTGRAFGIHLILSTQRPSADWLDGDIRSNLGHKICGSADETLSYVVFGDHRAADLIQPGEIGRFITEKGELFQAYWLDETLM